ncbi:LPXTG cell wall anchor domain-containing protein [Streptococcus suis]|uniref:LPXTG cell wall anchor domain-containing protein n=1 Tax=Streptococcus suis TaxID=1307 RepID=UPI000CF5BF70|nr:LPXTG cell wall anchor domain-containing protein [Streptococcus suis]
MKRSSRKKRLVKWSKLGLSLAAVTVLGGVVEPGVADFVSPKVYAETYVNTSDQLIGVVIWHFAENTDGSSFRLNGDGGYMEVQPGQEIRSSAPNYDGYTLSHTSYAPPAWDGGDGILSFVYKQNKIAEQPVSTEKPAGDANSSDTSAVSQPAETSDVIPTDTPIAPLTDSPTGNDIVNSTIQLVDQDGQILQTIQQSGAEGSEVRFEFPVISGYRVGKAEGFDGWNYMKEGTFRLAANKIVKVYYDKAPSIDALIRPEQRVEYQKVFDEFHNTILKAFEVYKKELGVDDITYEANDLEKIFADSNLSVLHSELVLVQPLFAKPVGLVLTDQDIINAIGWAPEYWDYQISYHKEITQELEKAMVNIAASKAIPTVPVDQSITIKAVYTEEQIEPGQKVDVLKEIEYTLKPGESVVLEPLTFEGWTSRVVQESQTVTYEEAKARPNKEYYFYYIEEGTTPTEKPIETPAETPTEKPAEQLVEKPTEQPVEKLVERPTASPTGQSASEKQATKQGDKEPAAPASQSKQATVKPASTSQSQAKSLPATGEASSVLHLTGLGLLGLAGLVVKRRSGKSS